MVQKSWERCGRKCLMPGYRFTEAAEHDVNSILDYTLQKRGVIQAFKNLNGLELHTQLLVDTPRLVKSADQFTEGL